MDVILQKLQKTLTFHSEDCLKHEYKSNGTVAIKPVQQLIVDGVVVCPRCEKEAEDNRVIDKLVQRHENRNESIFITKSLVSDKTILKARFDSYTRNVVEGSEEMKNKELAWQYAKRLKDGEQFNIFLQGFSGKSHFPLSYSILAFLNEEMKNAACLFVELSVMLREIRQSFSFKEHPYNEHYFVDLLSKVDFLVIDDLGAETGATNTEKMASDFVHRILKDVTNARQDKVTISTTNLSGKGLLSMYDAKTVSRLLKNPEYIMFKEATDKRLAKLPF